MQPDQKALPPQALSTTEVEQQIQDHFNAEPALANTNVGIKADESSVVLTGTVESDMQHELALRIAQSYAGDRKIVDKIRVRQET
jgi:osmotically-inducible protein OsmY